MKIHIDKNINRSQITLLEIISPMRIRIPESFRLSPASGLIMRMQKYPFRNNVCDVILFYYSKILKIIISF